MRLRRPLSDIAFFYCLALPTLLITTLLALLFYTQVDLSLPIIETQGLKTFIGTSWRPSHSPPPVAEYGLLPAVVGTFVAASVAVAISLPVSVMLVFFLEEVLPGRLRPLFASVVDASAGMPSIIMGIWGLYFLGPFLRENVMLPLYELLGFIPIFSCRPLSGATIMTAGVLLAIMITPFVSALIQEAYRSVPYAYVEAAYSLGMTRYEQARLRLSIIRGAVVSAVLMGFGRAASETAAVTLVVGNAYTLTACLFAPGYTITSLIANQFAESVAYPMMLNALFAGSLLLLCVGMAINAVGMAMLKRVRL